jgi:hypothetical protein
MAEARAAGHHCHDMTDVVGQAMHEALRLYQKYATSILPRRRPHEVRSKTPVLTPEQLHHGTIRVSAFDPGFKAAGLCLVELVGMQLPAGVTDPAVEPEPVFRVLLLQLLDLTCAAQPARIHYAPETAPVLAPPAERAPGTPDVYARAARVVADMVVELQVNRAAFLARKRAREAKRAANPRPAKRARVAVTGVKIKKEPRPRTPRTKTPATLLVLDETPEWLAQ